MSFGLYSKATAEEMLRDFLSRGDSSLRGVSTNYRDDKTPLLYFVKLTEDLLPATNPETGYTQATANVLKYTDTDDLDMEEVTDTDWEITITNRLTTLSLSSEDYTWVYFHQAEFFPIVGGSSGAQIIEFTIDNLNCPGDGRWNVLPVSFSGGCTAPIPGEGQYGLVEVRPNCTSPYTQDELEATGTGTAVYMYPRTGDCTPYWLELTSCATVECLP